MPHSLQQLFIQPQHAPVVSCQFKQTPTDFVVTEQLGFELTGEGEHLCIYLEKTNANTNQIATTLAKWAGVPVRDVSFCGLKDKFAITQQWFSLRIPNKIMPEQPFQHPNAHVLNTTWHQKKLARGIHQANAFKITLKNVVGEQTEIENQLSRIASEGVPNYFMAQRFGRDGNNLNKATALFESNLRLKKSERSMVLSAARSYIFNQILAKRVQDNTWNKATLGDVFNLAGSGSIFTADDIDDDIIQRTDNKDIHPTGALWGMGELKSTGSIALLENAVAQNNPIFAHGLEKAGLKQARRPLRLMVQDLSWQFTDKQTLVLTFSLGSGSYATAVLAALIQGFTG